MFKKSDVQDIYPLTPMQEGMLFHYLMNREASVYFEQAVLTVAGPLDLERFRQTFNRILEKYDILRTVFVYEKLKKPMQVVLKQRTGTVYFEDLTDMAGEEEKARRIVAFMEEDRKRGFKLEKDLLLRVSVLRTNSREYRITWSNHHIIMDGWCMGILIKDFMEVYGAYSRGETLEFQQPAPYSRYVQWLEKQDKQAGLDYWQHYLEGYEQQATLPKTTSLMQHEGIETGYRVGTFDFTLDITLSEGLREIAKAQQVTVNTVLHGIWGILLQRYNDTDDVVFGTVVSGRPPGVEGIEEMVGLFINSIPVRVKVEEDETFVQLLERLRNDAIRAKPFEYLPLADIQANSPLKGRLIDLSMGFQNYPVQKTVEVEGKPELEVLDMDFREESNYDFNCIVSAGESFFVNLNYNTLAYAQDLVETVARHLVTVIETVVKNPALRTGDIDILSKGDRQKLLVEFNGTEDFQPVEKTVHRLFEKQVEKTPEQIAVTGTVQGVDTELTYLELNERANRLARYLVKEGGVKRGDRVGMVLDACFHLAEAIFAILKAGAAYVPLVPQLPQERLAGMIKDAGIKVLVSLSSHAPLTKVLEHTCTGLQTVVFLDTKLPAEGSGVDFTAVESSHRDIVYVIYTSGTTGKPKGIVLEHWSLVNFILFRIRTYGFSASDTCLQVISPAFDGFAAIFFPLLFTGGKVVMVDEEYRLNLTYIEAMMRKEKVTHLVLVPSMYRHYLEGVGEGAMANVRTVTLAAERTDRQLIENSKRLYPHICLSNEYGPTEAAVAATYLPEMTPAAPAIIGKPIPNCFIYILGRNLDLLPVYVPGELCIGGIGLARGYLNNPELTAQTFVISHLSFVNSDLTNDQCPMTDDRLYLTGDLARWLPDGSIEFLGRKDHQVKVRGFRVELTEIEHHLLGYDPAAIKKVVVTTRGEDSGDTHLCAYLEAVAGSVPGPEILRDYLAKKLPDYMIPASFIQLERIPLSVSGKIDYRALPEMVPTEGSEDRDIEAPVNETETELRAIWADVLGLDKERIGRHADFFRLGGHSLKALSLVNAIHKTFEKRVEIQRVFQVPTIALLASEIERNEAVPFMSIPRQPDKTYCDLSYAQRRLWVLQRKNPQSAVFNMPERVTMQGDVDVEKVREAAQQLVDRHAGLRTSFREVDGDVFQYPEPAGTVTVVVEQEDLSALPAAQVEPKRQQAFIDEWHTPFALDRAPLLRLKLIRCSATQSDLVFNMHHLVSDGWSMGILQREFKAVYRGLCSGEQIDLPPLNLRYTDYSEWHNRLLTDTETLEPVLRFWRQTFQGPMPVLDLPYDVPESMRKTQKSAGYRFKVAESVLERLRELAGQHNTSLFTVLLAALNLLLSFLRGQTDILLAFPGAARPHEDLKDMIGLFVNTLIIRTDIRLSETFREFLERVRQDTMKVLEYQAYPMEMIFDHLNIKYPRVPVFFNMQNIVESQQERMEDFDEGHIEELQDTKFDIVFYLMEFKDGLSVMCHYYKELFYPESIEKICRLFITLLSGIGEEPDKPVGRYKSGKRRKISRQ
jgi:amino acid adenylation domain-containing protein